MAEHGASEASERAIEVARAALSQNMDAFEAAAEALSAAHDPALGLDRSVCLRDVVEAIRAYDPDEEAQTPRAHFHGYEDFDTEQAASFILRAFTESSSPDKEE